ncbi:MAG TPA: chorismate-binding protein [Rhodocyclaceae bacterium]
MIDFPDGPGRLRRALLRPEQCWQAWQPDDVAGVIAAAEAAARDGRWVVGFVAYEAAAAFDAALQTHAPHPALPLAAFAAYGPAAEGPPPPGEFHCSPWRPEIDEARFAADVAAIREAISDGAYYQSNHTTRLRSAFAGDGGALFAALQAAQPGGYGIHLDGGEWQILSVSPELFFDWTAAGTLMTRPMKGTAARGGDPTGDAAAREQLAASAKDRAENLMIVDLLRNDLSRLAVTGSVRVPALFELEALPTAWQMTSTVSCQTRPGTTLVDVFRALFPCGSITGAPKVAAMRAIAAREVSPRGAYCGAIGVIRPGGHASFNVGIRTVTLFPTVGRAECGIGSGITLDSETAAELAEWGVKTRFLHRASAGFQLLETLRLEDGVYPRGDAHLRRMRAGAEYFGFPWDDARAAAALAALAEQHGHGAWRVRLLLDRRGDATAAAYPLEATSAEARVALATQPIAGDPAFLRHKTTERSAYDAFASPAGVFDTLLWNGRGEITEFTRGNVVLELDGRRVTPPLACGLLPGVLRAELLARGDVVEAVVRREDLARATGLWFVNSLRGQIPARLL